MMKQNVALSNIEMFGVECVLLNVEDADIRVNIVFCEYHDFQDLASYDSTVDIPNWASFLLDQHVMGRKLILSAHLIVKASHRNNSVVSVPYVPFRPIKGVNNDQCNYLTALG